MRDLKDLTMKQLEELKRKLWDKVYNLTEQGELALIDYTEELEARIDKADKKYWDVRKEIARRQRA